MNCILAAALAVVLTATAAQAQQNMIDYMPNNTPPAPSASGVMDMNPSFNPYTGAAESNRSQVSAVQAELKARGYRIKIDGAYGPKTRAAVKSFQRKHRLQVDGQIGPQTLHALGLANY